MVGFGVGGISTGGTAFDEGGTGVSVGSGVWVGLGVAIVAGATVGSGSAFTVASTLA